MNSAQLNPDLRAAIADLTPVNPWEGLLRFSIFGGVFFSLAALAWGFQYSSLIGNAAIKPIAFCLTTAIAGVVYAFWLICTHDMVHQTLTGWPWFETALPRLISWPMGWPYGLYAELHRLHHGWNGVDLRDPERVQWTVTEYETTIPFLRWYVRHQWLIDILLLGGIGLILKTFAHALRLQAVTPGLRQQLRLDITGIVAVQGVLVTLAFWQQQLLTYLLFWLMLERVIGVVMQTRDHLEHYGLWGKTSNYQLTQLYACRNLQVPLWVNGVMGGLPYHGVHHAFPEIPANHLPEAFDRLQAVLQRHELPPMILDPGYGKTTWQLSQHPTVIDTPITAKTAGGDRPGRNPMIPVYLMNNS